MRAVFLGLFIFGTVFGQNSVSGSINVVAIPISKAGTKSILGGRLAKSYTLWTIVMTNASGESVSVSSSAVLSHMSQMHVLDAAVASQVVGSAQTYSVLERVFRVLGDGSATAGFLATGKVFTVSPVANSVLLGAGWALPYAAARLKGIEVPVASNYAALAWTTTVPIPSGSTGVGHVMTQLWKDSDPVNFIIDASKVTVTTTRTLQ